MTNRVLDITNSLFLLFQSQHNPEEKKIGYNVPVFANCSSYKPRVKEDQATGTHVITVSSFTFISQIELVL